MAQVASAHGLDFSASPKPAMTQELHPYLHPLQFLQNRLSAALTTYTTSPSQPSSPTQTDTPTFTPIQDEPSAELKDHSEHGSIASSVDQVKDSPQASKSRTSYYFAHPPPRTNNHHRRQGLPKMLLQLRRMSADRRASPVLEVFPSTTVSRSLKKRLPRLASQQTGLGRDDLVVLNCDSYNESHLSEGKSTTEEISEAEDLDHRTVVGTIHRGIHDEIGHDLTAEIFVGKTRWTASRLKRGGYEFTSFSALGNERKVRWVPRNQKASRRQSYQESLQRPGVDNFGFSLINPSLRRHPFVGFMDRSAIEILDQHMTLSSSFALLRADTTVGTRPSTNRFHSTESYHSGEFPPPNSIVDTTEDTKVLMLITGVWVAMAEGWSEAIRSHGDGGSSVSSPVSSPSKRNPFSSVRKASNTKDARMARGSSVGSDESRTLRPSLTSAPPSIVGHLAQRQNSLRSVTNTLSSDGMQESVIEGSLGESSGLSKRQRVRSLVLPPGKPLESLPSPSLETPLDLVTPKDRRRMTFDASELLGGGTASTATGQAKTESRHRPTLSTIQVDIPSTDESSAGQRLKKRHKLFSFMNKKFKDG